MALMLVNKSSRWVLGRLCAVAAVVWLLSDKGAVQSKRSADDDEDGPGSRFECNICLDVASDPVTTLCGQLFWYVSLFSLQYADGCYRMLLISWPCLYEVRINRVVVHRQSVPLLHRPTQHSASVVWLGRHKEHDRPTLSGLSVASLCILSLCILLIAGHRITGCFNI